MIVKDHFPDDTLNQSLAQLASQQATAGEDGEDEDEHEDEDEDQATIQLSLPPLFFLFFLFFFYHSKKEKIVKSSYRYYTLDILNSSFLDSSLSSSSRSANPFKPLTDRNLLNKFAAC
jgi:hypothetical protein